jgi:hypothetical protein
MYTDSLILIHNTNFTSKMSSTTRTTEPKDDSRQNTSFGGEIVGSPEQMCESTDAPTCPTAPHTCTDFTLLSGRGGSGSGSARPWSGNGPDLEGMWSDMAAGDDSTLVGKNVDGLQGKKSRNEIGDAVSKIEGKGGRRSVSVSTGHTRQMKTSLPATHQEQGAGQKSATIPGVSVGGGKRQSE